jgi:hypothetical protein
LARHFANHALDENDIENNRACFAAACIPLAATLPVDIRNDLFDRLFRLAVGSDEPVSRFDELERRFGDPFAPFHIERTPGRLRRQVIMTLVMIGQRVATAQHLRDAAQDPDRIAEIKREWLKVPGQKSGITWHYVQMLAGIPGVKT